MPPVSALSSSVSHLGNVSVTEGWRKLSLIEVLRFRLILVVVAYYEESYNTFTNVYTLG